VTRILHAWARLRRLGPADRVALACVVTACAFALANAHLFAAVEIDDAFITFRYADNLAHGLGPVFNVGEHVEGTSSLLFAAILAIAIRLGARALGAARLLSTAAYLGLTLLAYATVMSCGGRWRRRVGVGAAAIVAASTPLAYYARSGLETDVYAFLILLAIFLLVRSPPGEQRAGWAVAAGLCAIARPEGVFFAITLWALAAARGAMAARTPRLALSCALRSAIALACVVGPLIVFRRAYYHEWIPNTVLAKSGASHRFNGLPIDATLSLAATGQGFDSLAEYAGHIGIGMFFAIAGLVSSRARFVTAVSLAIAAGCAALAIWSDGDWMGYERLLTAAMAPMAVAMSLGLEALFAARAASDRTSRAIGAAIAFGAGALVVNGSFYDRRGWAPDAPGTAHAAYVERLAVALRDDARGDDLLATDMAGKFPFYSKIRTIDTFGLCDAHIARFGKPWPRMGKTDLDYVIRRRPTFYYFNFAATLNDLYGRPAFVAQQDEYLAILAPEYLAYPRADRKLLAVRRDRPDVARLAKALDARLVDVRDELHRLGVR